MSDRCESERQMVEDQKQNLDAAQRDQAMAQSDLNKIDAEAATAAGLELVCMIRAGLAGGVTAGPLGVGIGMGICIGTGSWAIWKLGQRAAEASQRLHDARLAESRARRDLSAAYAALMKCEELVPDTGCGSRGGPGWRRPDGKCASWDDVDPSPAPPIAVA